MSILSQIVVTIEYQYHELGLDISEIAKNVGVSEEFVREAVEFEYNSPDEYDDSMDGDHESALASAGWGTDEDYGYSGE
jgi:hypothetical protein